MKRFMEGFIEAMQHIRQNKEDSVRTLARVLATNDKLTLEHAYDDIVSSMDPSLMPSSEAVNNLLKMVAYTDKRAGGMKPERILDFSLLEEIRAAQK